MENGHKQEIHIMPPGMVVRAVTIALGVLALWIGLEALSTIKEYRFIGSGVTATNTINVSGEGEAVAVPDIATFTLSVQEEAQEVAAAQEVATEKVNNIIETLADMGIAKRDIQTTSYNVFPRYEYREEALGDGNIRPPQGQRVLVGYEVSQSLQVKVRETDRAGEILAEAGRLGVSNISGLSFTIDDEDEIQREAREKAIADAREKAQQLASDLGVELVRIVGFSESGGGQPPVMFARMESADAATGFGGGAPQLPTGENKVTSNVTVQYEIR